MKIEFDGWVIPTLTKEMIEFRDENILASHSNYKGEEKFTKELAKLMGLRPSKSSKLYYALHRHNDTNYILSDHPRGTFIDDEYLYNFAYPYTSRWDSYEQLVAELHIPQNIEIYHIGDEGNCYNESTSLVITRMKRKGI